MKLNFIALGLIDMIYFSSSCCNGSNLTPQPKTKANNIGSVSSVSLINP